MSDPRETSIRERLRRRSVEALSHQLRIEREQRRSSTTSDLFAVALVFGLTTGAMSFALSPRLPSLNRKKKGTKR